MLACVCAQAEPSDALEYDHGDLAAGPGLILVVGRPHTGHQLPQRRLLFRHCRARPRGEALGADLDRDIRMYINSPGSVVSAVCVVLAVSNWIRFVHARTS